MLPAFLLPPGSLEQNGTGEPVAVGEHLRHIILTLVIQKVLEQQSLLLAVEGSNDGVTWLTPALCEFPQRFYTGTCALLLDLSTHSEVRYLRAQWKVNRWGRGDKKPHFECYLAAESL